MDKYQVLYEFGLSQKEATVYIKLLEMGTATSGQLMKQLGMYSKTVYETLDKLAERGLVSHVMIKRAKNFEAATPERFLDLVFEEQKVLQSIEKDVKRIIPQLKRKVAGESAHIQKDFSTILDDALKPRSDIVAYGGSANLRSALMSDAWHKRRTDAKVRMKVLLTKEYKKMELKYKALSARYATIDDPTTVLVYGDNVALVSWGAETTCTVIKSKDIAKRHAEHFSMLWGKAR